MRAFLCGTFSRIGRTGRVMMGEAEKRARELPSISSTPQGCRAVLWVQVQVRQSIYRDFSVRPVGCPVDRVGLRHADRPRSGVSWACSCLSHNCHCRRGGLILARSQGLIERDDISSRSYLMTVLMFWRRHVRLGATARRCHDMISVCWSRNGVMLSEEDVKGRLSYRKRERESERASFNACPSPNSPMIGTCMMDGVIQKGT
jgi:hypothetical protein